MSPRSWLRPQLLVTTLLSVGLAAGASALASAKTLTWRSTTTTAWETATNWYDEGAAAVSSTAPTSADLVAINSTRGATLQPTVSTAAQACKQLIVDAGFTLTIAANATSALSVGDGLTGNNDIWILPGGEIDMLSTAAAGNPFTLLTPANDKIRMEPGAKIFWNSSRGITAPFPAANCDFDANSTFEFAHLSGAAVAVTGRTFGNLTLSDTVPKTYTASFGSANVFNVLGTLTLSSSNVTFNCTLTGSAVPTLNNVTLSGGTLGWATSTAPLTITGNIVNLGTWTNSSVVQPVSFNGNTTLFGNPITWTNGFTVNAGKLLVLSSPYVLSAGKIATINGTLQLAGSQVPSAPTYGSASTLDYNEVAGFTPIGNEWGPGSTPGVGVPQNVILENAITLQMNGPRSVPGNLTSNVGATSIVLGGTGDLTVGGVLALGSDRITTGASKVVLPGGASLTRTTGYVVGNLQKDVATGSNVSRTFEIGDGVNYTPASVNFASVSAAGSLVASTAVLGAPPASGFPPSGSGLSQTKYVKRSWTLTNSGTVFTTYDATLNFVSADLQGGANTNNLLVGKNSAGTWSNPTLGTRTSTSTQATGLSAFSDFYLGESGCPTFLFAPAAGALPGGQTATAYSQAIVASGGTGPYTYAVTAGSLSAGLSLSTAGSLTGTPTAIGNSSFTVTATDANGCTGNVAYTLAVTCPTITVAPAAGALPGGNTSAAYSQTITASGGTAPYSFVVTAGSLPTGLTLATGGAISGTPTALGNASFTVTATDANGCTGSAAYTLNVTCGAIAVAPGSLPNGTQNSAYSQTITASGGIGPYTFAVTSGTLPAGLSLASGGALTGTPTGTGNSNFDVTATDANGCTGVQSYALTIDPAAVNTVSPVSASACVTPAHPCQTVPVTSRAAMRPVMRLFHVTFQLSANLQLCSTPGEASPRART